MSTLLVEECDDRVVVTVNRPDVRNAINAAMVGELHEVCALLERRPRLLLLTRAGGVFAGGADIAELRDADATRRCRASTAGCSTASPAFHCPRWQR